ncbi:hypothetical protein D3Z53_26400, partial [Lachnospiraceae bacterium]|nr:hypothetical protein [Lachnospiraceae bacterium]
SIGISVFLMQKFCHFASKNIYKWPKCKHETLINVRDMTVSVCKKVDG